MKKFFVGALLLSFILGFTGCAKLGEGAEQDPVSTLSTEETTEVFAIGDVLSTKSGEFCVNQVYCFEIDADAKAQLEATYGGNSMNKVEEGLYLVVDVSYTNLLTEDYKVNQESFEVYLDNDQIFCPKWADYFSAYVPQGQMFQERTLHPGRTERGFIIYRYYRNADTFEFVCNGVSVEADTSKINMIALPEPTPIPEETQPVEQTVQTEQTTTAPQQPSEVPADTQPVETQPTETAAPEG